MLLTLFADFLCLLSKFECFIFDCFFGDVVAEGDVLEGVFDVEHGGVVHVEEGVEHLFLVLKFAG